MDEGNGRYTRQGEGVDEGTGGESEEEIEAGLVGLGQVDDQSPDEDEDDEPDSDGDLYIPPELTKGGVLSKTLNDEGGGIQILPHAPTELGRRAPEEALARACMPSYDDLLPPALQSKAGLTALDRWQAYHRVWDDTHAHLQRTLATAHDHRQSVLHPVLSHPPDEHDHHPDQPTRLPLTVLSSPDPHAVHFVLSAWTHVGLDGQQEGSQTAVGQAKYDPATRIISCALSSQTLSSLSAISTSLLLALSSLASPASVLRLPPPPQPAPLSQLTTFVHYWSALSDLNPDHRPRLLLILNDFQSLDPELAHDFIASLSSLYLRGLLPRLSLLTHFNSSSGPAILSSILPPALLRTLHIHLLPVRLPTDILHRLLHDTFFSTEFTPTLLLNPTALRCIREGFNRAANLYDVALSLIQYAHMDHYSTELGLLASFTDQQFDQLSTILQLESDRPQQQHFAQVVRSLVSSRSWKMISEALTVQSTSKSVHHDDMCILVDPSSTASTLVQMLRQARTIAVQHHHRFCLHYQLFNRLQNFVHAMSQFKVPATDMLQQMQDALDGRLVEASTLILQKLRYDLFFSLLHITSYLHQGLLILSATSSDTNVSGCL